MGDRIDVVKYASIDEFCKAKNLPLPHRIEFDRSKVNQQELDVLKNNFVNLCVDLTLYGELFSSEENIEVLNEFNSLVFSRLQRIYIENICLSISCLLDPANTGSNKNLSLAYIVKQCDCTDLESKLYELQTLYESTGIKRWRQKMLAHNDLNTLMGKTNLDLTFEGEDIEDIVVRIQEILDDISNPNVCTDVKVVLPPEKNGSAFIQRLRRSLKNTMSK